VLDRAEQPVREGQSAPAGAPPGKHSFRVGQFVFLHDFDLNPGQSIFRELAELRELVVRELKLPGSHAVIQIYLFEDQDRYENYMRLRYPELPKRRAFFVAQPRGVGAGEDLLVYTFWGRRVREDLRHELTHAVLHSVLRDVPLWLDEGLAEYFEVPPEWEGVNPTHLDHLRRGSAPPFQPDLSRLEQLSQVQQMTPAEYREAWAWVHLMLHDRPEARAVLVHYLQLLRTSPHPVPLGSFLAAVYPSPAEALNRHLARLDVLRTLPRVTNSPRIE
jgi:hypothetical protein